MSQLAGRFKQTPSEHRRYVADLTQDLSSGETISTLPSTVTLIAGDGSASLVVDNVAIDSAGLQAVFYVQGGADGQSYNIKFLPTTSIGQTLEFDVQIDIAEKV